ncbi:MAG: tRNA1(Val) (adenine(37)-N6)-methyltransferase [Clostridia bacterium]
MANLKLENFENGIKLYQDEDLYKFTSDSIKLAKFCNIKSTDNVLDMCAGCGVIGLYAYSINPFNKIYFNDIQPKMCDIINQNIQLNNLQNKSKVICKNLKDLNLNDFDKKLDIIICNPPYFKLNGKINQENDIAICRHEIETNLEGIIYKASQLLKTKGKFYLVLPADRLTECIVLLNKYKFEAKEIEMLCVNNKVNICLISSTKDAKSGVNIKISKGDL